MGGTFGTAVFGTILNSRLAANLDELVPAGSASTRNLTSSPERIAALPAAVKGPVIEAFVRSQDTVFLASVTLVALAFLLTSAIKELPLRAAGPAPTAAGDPVLIEAKG